MAANKPFAFGPVALVTTLTTNIFNPGTTTGGVASTPAPYDKLFALIFQVRVVNKTGTAATFTLYKGATGANAAGTELAVAQSVPANDYVELVWPKGIRFNTTDFLVGGAGTTTALTIQGVGEIGIA